MMILQAAVELYFDKFNQHSPWTRTFWITLTSVNSLMELDPPLTITAIMKIFRKEIRDRWPELSSNGSCSLQTLREHISQKEELMSIPYTLEEMKEEMTAYVTTLFQQAEDTTGIYTSSPSTGTTSTQSTIVLSATGVAAAGSSKTRGAKRPFADAFVDALQLPASPSTTGLISYSMSAQVSNLHLYFVYNHWI